MLLRELEEKWRARAKLYRTEATDIHQVTKGVTEAETRCITRALTLECCADDLARVIAEREEQQRHADVQRTGNIEDAQGDEFEEQ